jgi:tRNA(Ile)-lysidine synthase
LTNPALVALAAFAGSRALVLAPPLAVAYSGGADSTALLHAACALWPGQVRAIHVNHDLQAAAAQFESNCTTVCEQLHVPLQVVKVKAGHATGESPEDAARKARYTGLADAARALGVSQVLLGQHADDQVETILLALSRGAGLAGLSAMPAFFERAGVQFLRPLLDVPGASLRDWLTQAGHAFVDDPSNTDERYTRNRIRARLLPALADAFPHFRQTFARSASHAAQAQVVLDEVAAQDLLQVGSPPAIKALQALSRPRQANVLRHWLLVCHQVRPSAAQLAELLDQVAACTTRGHQIHLKVANGHVLRAVSYLQWLAPI